LAERIWLLPAIVVEETAQAKERRRRWTVAEGRKMAKGAKKGKGGEKCIRPVRVNRTPGLALIPRWKSNGRAKR
jgi:hypothetical protein